VLAGAAAYPALGESIAAATGLGCWSDGVRCHVSNVADLSRATVLTTDERFEHSPDRRIGWTTLGAAAANARTWGDCYGYLLVATGRAEVMVDGTLRPWDIAPFLPVITEAGGVLVDYAGRSTAFGDGAIASNALLASSAQQLLGVGR
jgi:fructose-1,6-bisphosphatase/inositol monophosphatase family enzyme